MPADTRPYAPLSRGGQILLLCSHEFKRILRQFIRYPVAAVVVVVVMLLIFLGLVQMALGVSSGADRATMSFMTVAQRYVIWSTTITGISSVSGNIEDDTRAGTMEMAWLSPVPFWLILLARASASTFLVVLINVLLAVAIGLFVGFGSLLSLSFLLAVWLAGIGGMSLGLILGAFVIRFKSIGPAANVFQFLLLPTFLGSAAPPLWIGLVPSGGALLYAMAPDQHAVLLGAIGISMVWLVIGSVSITLAQHRSRTLGIVNQY